jgi:class 3 adenylate cyclase
VLAWIDEGNTPRLKALVAGRVVALGSILPRSDRLAVPLPLAAWEPVSIDVPGVVVHAQALRTLLADLAITPSRALLPPALAMLATTLWWLPSGGWRPSGLALGAVMLLFGAAVLLLDHGIALAVGSAIAAIVVSVGARKALDASLAVVERRRLRDTFGGYVSPQLLDRLLADGIDPGRPDGPRPMAFLFADLRGFTTRVQHEPATDTIAMLNRYYDAIVAPAHAEGGLIDNFRGDGILVVFGAPEPIAQPARAAARAAAAMRSALGRLNVVLASEGHEPLAMGLGLAYGDAVAGELGSRQRHDYTVIGDAVNVAARLQDQCRVLGVTAIASQAFVDELAAGDATTTDLGDLDLKGHMPVRAHAID